MDKTTQAGWQPGDPLPKYANRDILARIITHHSEPVAARSLAYHPLVIIKSGRSSVFEVKTALAYFDERLKRAPKIRQATKRQDPRNYAKAGA